MGSIVKPEEKETTAQEWQKGGQWSDVAFISSFLLGHIQAGASDMPASILEWQGGECRENSEWCPLGPGRQRKFCLMRR